MDTKEATKDSLEDKKGTRRIRARASKSIPIPSPLTFCRHRVQLGVDVSCSDNGCPPVKIKAAGLKGGTTRVSGKISSQYLSALLMAAPLSSGEVVVEITDELVSAPYVHMTIKLMDKFG